ncbi:MAG: flavin monoamine oxidase family protein, partial [bacterium]
MADEFDFAIVGGGASGVYSAWRLAHASDRELKGIRARIGGEGPLKIAVFEQSDRTGGRLLSASPPSMPATPLELGGMRYLNTQPLVKGLVEKKLQIKSHQQDVDEPDNIAYLRGRMFRQSELHDPGVELPYVLPEREKWILKSPSSSTPAELIFWAVFQEFPQIKGMQPAELAKFLQTAKVGDKPLYQVGFWNLLSRHLSHEGRQLAITAIGYDVLGANANAVDIIAENFDFTPGTKYYLFDDGFEAVIWRLQSEFETRGGTVKLNASLASFDEAVPGDPGGGLELTFETGEPVKARAIVLAMPPAAIRRLLRRGPLLDPRIEHAGKVRRLMNSVEGIPLYKLFVIYDRPWWKEQL